MSDAADLDAANRLFRRFQGRYRTPQKKDIIELGGLEKPVTALLVGTVIGIKYKALGNGVSYEHLFEDSLPKLYVNAAGDQLYFLDGSYRFTDRGFIK